MKINSIAALLVLITAVNASAESALPECDVSSNVFGSDLMERGRNTVTSVLDVRGDLKNNAVISYAKNDPVLVVDMTVTQVIPTIVPSADIALNSSWMLSPNFRLRGGQSLESNMEITGRDGRVYTYIFLNGRNALLLFNDEGRFCNKVLNSSSPPYVWMAGTLSQEPGATPIDRRLTERPGKPMAMRVIFNGISAGQISFQEVWVNSSTVLFSQARIFDQFSKEISIGPFAFEVLGFEGEKVKLRYDIPSRSQPSAAILARLH